MTAAKSKRRLDEALRKFGKSKRADHHRETALMPALASIRAVDVRICVGELDHLGVNLPEFLAFSPKVPNLLFPAFHVQVRHQGGRGGLLLVRQ